jgi:hypothetical protein
MPRAFVSGTLAVLVTAVAAFSVARAATDLSKMSMKDMEAQAGKMVEDMEGKLKEAFKLLEEAISEGDVAATNARNEAITAMKGLVKLAEENYVTLQQKAAEGDVEAVKTEFVKISIAQAKTAELFAQVQTAGGIAVDLEAAGVEKSVKVEGELPVLPEITVTFVDAPASVAEEDPAIISEQAVQTPEAVSEIK